MVGRMILYHDRRYEQCYDKGAYCAKENEACGG